MENGYNTTWIDCAGKNLTKNDLTTKIHPRTSIIDLTHNQASTIMHVIFLAYCNIILNSTRGFQYFKSKVVEKE